MKENGSIICHMAKALCIIQMDQFLMVYFFKEILPKKEG